MNSPHRISDDADDVDDGSSYEVIERKCPAGWMLIGGVCAMLFVSSFALGRYTARFNQTYHV